MPIAAETIDAPGPTPASLRPRTGINHVKFSQVGHVIAASDVHMNVTVLSANEIRYSHTYQSSHLKARPTERIRGLAFGPDASILYVAAGDTVRAVQWKSGEEQWSYTAPKAFGFLIVLPVAMAVSKAGDVAASFENGMIVVWSETGEVKAKWRDVDLPRSMAFLDDGSLVGCDSFAFSVWKPDTGEKTFRRIVGDRLFSLATNGEQLVVTRSLGAATIWELESGSPVASIPVEIGLPLVEICRRRSLIALGAEHGINLFNFDGRRVDRIDVPDTRVLSMAFAPDGDDCCIGGADENLRMFPLPGL